MVQVRQVNVAGGLSVLASIPRVRALPLRRTRLSRYCLTDNFVVATSPVVKQYVT